MKIRNPWLIKLIAFLGSWLVKFWMSTIRFHYRPLSRVNWHRCLLQDPSIFTFWHENLLMPCYHYASRDFHVLIRQHADGELIARICMHLGFRTIRGSATRGGIQALRKMVRACKHGHVVVVPDGPRGPRRHVELGLIYLAARTGLPIVVAGFGYDRPWRLPTWDRFAVPRPWSRAIMVTLDPIWIPKGADKAQMEYYRQEVERTLEQASIIAEKWAEQGGRRFPKDCENPMQISQDSNEKKNRTAA